MNYRKRTEKWRLCIPKYLAEYIEKKCKAHETSRSHEVSNCIFLSWMSEKIANQDPINYISQAKEFVRIQEKQK